MDVCLWTIINRATVYTVYTYSLNCVCSVVIATHKRLVCLAQQTCTTNGVKDLFDQVIKIVITPIFYLQYNYSLRFFSLLSAYIIILQKYRLYMFVFCVDFYFPKPQNMQKS